MILNLKIKLVIKTANLRNMQVVKDELINGINSIKEETIEVLLIEDLENAQDVQSTTLTDSSHFIKEEKFDIIEVFTRQDKEPAIPTVSSDLVNETTSLFNASDEIEIKEEALSEIEYDVSNVESSEPSRPRRSSSNRKKKRKLSGERFVCLICKKSFARGYGLRRHELIHIADKTHHEEKIEVQETPYQCTICTSKFTRHYSLQRHIKAHTDPKTFKKAKVNVENCNEKHVACQYCDYKCTINSVLLKHMSVHGEDKPFHCNICDYRCSRKDYLRRHAAVHDSDKRFECTQCDYKCSDATSIRRHSKIHAGDKPFSCHLCNYKCLTGSHLKRHMSIHMKERFYCLNCPYRTTSKVRLNKHAVHCKKKI